VKRSIRSRVEPEITVSAYRYAWERATAREDQVWMSRKTFGWVIESVWHARSKGLAYTW